MGGAGDTADGVSLPAGGAGDGFSAVAPSNGHCQGGLLPIPVTRVARVVSYLTRLIVQSATHIDLLQHRELC